MFSLSNALTGVIGRLTGMQSKAATVAEYLDALPPDRREAIDTLRAVFRRNMDKQIVERMSYGMIGYAVPHSIYPAGYHCDPSQPLPFAGIASQKNHMSLHLFCTYLDGDALRGFVNAWARTGKKLDMGKACIRFKSVDDLALDVIADVLKRTTVKSFIKLYESVIAASGTRGAEKTAARKTRAKRAAAKGKEARKTAKTPSRR